MPGHAQSFWGAGFTTQHPFWKHANVAAYYYGLDRKNSVFEKGAGRTIRNTIGSRSWKTTHAWDFNYEGSSNGDRLKAGRSMRGRSPKTQAIRWPRLDFGLASEFVLILQVETAVPNGKRLARSIPCFRRHPSTSVRPRCLDRRISSISLLRSGSS